MAKKKKAAKAPRSAKATSIPRGKRTVRRRAGAADELSTDPKPIQIKHGEKIDFKLLLPDAADYKPVYWDITPDDPNSVRLLLPSQLLFDPDQASDEGQIELASRYRAFVYIRNSGSREDAAALGIATGKLKITIRPPTFRGPADEGDEHLLDVVFITP